MTISWKRAKNGTQFVRVHVRPIVKRNFVVEELIEEYGSPSALCYAAMERGMKELIREVSVQQNGAEAKPDRHQALGRGDRSTEGRGLRVHLHRGEETGGPVRGDTVGRRRLGSERR